MHLGDPNLIQIVFNLLSSHVTQQGHCEDDFKLQSQLTTGAKRLAFHRENMICGNKATAFNGLGSPNVYLKSKVHQNHF